MMPREDEQSTPVRRILLGLISRHTGPAVKSTILREERLRQTPPSPMSAFHVHKRTNQGEEIVGCERSPFTRPDHHGVVARMGGAGRVIEYDNGPPVVVIT